MAAVPVRAGITIPAGDDYAHTVNFTDANNAAVDVSARTFTAQIRAYDNVAAAVLAEFTVDTTDAATGTIVLRLTAAETTALHLAATSAGMDLQQDNAGTVSTLFRAAVTIEGEYTR